jgi:predicted N-acyltransferase
MSDSKYRIKIHTSITEISSHIWNNLITPDTVPFLEWEWLAALEESGSIAPETGWQPLHFCLWEGEKLIAAASFYLKANSDGEYVYDYFWVEAAASMKKPWYPKLVGTVAATPAEGYRFLFAPGIDSKTVSVILLEAAESFCRKNGIVSLNLLFADPEWAKDLPGLGYTSWEHSHFLWENPGYKNFEDYLAVFSKNQRKNIRKEYRSPAEQGVTVKITTGEEASEDHYRKMFELFTLTNDKFIPWDARWVNEDFFLRLEKTYRKGTAFVEASREGEIIALAFLVHKSSRIWGRFWGAYEEVKDLHFAACYYTPMDWCIKEGIHFFDPGAGSPHKIRRGFKSVIDKSWHKFFDPTLERLFKNNIANVNQYEEENRRLLNEGLPFKQTRPFLS